MKFDNDKFIFNDELIEIENFYNTDVSLDLHQLNNDNVYLNSYKKNEPYNLKHDSYQKFCSTKEGFLKGNMLKHEFKPYKNLTYLPIVPKNAREAKLLPVYEYDHAINDLNLYLDLYPEDQEAFDLFKKCVMAFKNAKREYESVYGPLCVEDTLGSSFNWSQDPWPWDKDGESKYV